MLRHIISGLAFVAFAVPQICVQAESELDYLVDAPRPGNSSELTLEDSQESINYDAQQVGFLSGCCEPSCGADDCCGSDCGDGVGCGCGVGKKGAAGANPCAASHKGLFYANDFSYLKDPCYNGACLGDAMKLMPLAGGRWGTLDIGGQYRMRYHNEIGMGRVGAAGQPRFEDTESDFMLYRMRLYSNWKVNDLVRIYTEGIYAEATDDGGDYFARPIDVNKGDFLNLFIDLKLTDSLTVRTGRQELLYGAQRTVSPLDWANTRRTFDGVKFLYTNGDWNVDTFYTFFVPVNPDELDEADYDQAFYGVYGTYGGFENFTIDTYYLGYDNQNPGGDFSLHTMGLRLNGSVGNWLWEMEGGPQFGRQSGLGLDHMAGFATCGLGRKVQKLPGGTTIWFYYDYASGDNGVGDFNGFNQLFPLAHKYLGFIDAVQRSNIQSPNVLLTMKPGKKWNFLVWYYHFMSDTAAAVPSIGNTASQNASKDLGDEIDFIVKYGIGPRSNILLGWSRFFRGDKINGPQDASFLYSQWTVNF